MNKYLEALKIAYNSMFDNKAYLLMALLALLFLFILNKHTDISKYILYGSIIIILIVCNPLIGYVIAIFIGKGVYWRVFWMLPIVIMIAYSITWCIQKQDKNKKLAVGIIFTLIIVMCGDYMFSSDNFTIVNNAYKVSDETVAVCNMLLADEEDVRAIVPLSLSIEVRQYDASIKLLFGRKDYDKDLKKVVQEIDKDIIDIELIDEYAKKYDCTHVVIKNSSELSESPEEYDWKCISTIGNYIIYNCR